MIRCFSAAAAEATTTPAATLDDIYFNRESTRKITQIDAHGNGKGELTLSLPFLRGQQQSISLTA